MSYKHSTISRELYFGNESWNYDRIVKALGHKLRVEIRRNFYDDQSWARVSAWDGSKWSIVATKPIQTCDCASVSATDRELTEYQERLFLQDSTTLFDIACEVIS